MNKYYLLTEDGVVVDIKDQTDLPNIAVNSQKLVKEYTFGDTINEEVIFASNIVKNLKYLYSINSVILFDDYIEATTNESIKLIYPNSGDIDLLIGSTRLIFSRLNQGVEGIRMNEVGEIDLRYKNPIIRKK